MNPLHQQLELGGPLVLYFIVVLIMVLLVIGLSHFLGERHHETATHEPYESGIVHIGDTHVRFSAPYFLIAILFVIFDLEAAFIYIWAVSLQEAGWAGYIEIFIFITILAAALLYLWKVGALEWGPKGRSQHRKPPRQGESAVLNGASAPVNPPQP